MMSPELRARWAAALREPERVQGHGQLCKIQANGTEAQCCLDVLIDLYRKDHPEGTEGALRRRTDEFGSVYYEAGVTVTLPEPVCRWARVRHSPMIGNIPAVNLNDSLGKTFAQIADLIDDEANEIH